MNELEDTKEKGITGQMKKSNKEYRLLDIFYQLMWDNQVTLAGIAQKYGVTEKTIGRDINVIRAFLSENREQVGNVEAPYDTKEKRYRLNRLEGLSSQELLIILKILVGSRALDKESLREAMDRLMICANNTGQEIFRDFCKIELDYYRGVQKEDGADIPGFVWKLEKAIQSGKSICIVYEKLEGGCVDRNLYPISVVFSNFYFYLLACRSDIEESAVIYYRVDRMKEIREGKERIPVSLEKRHRLDGARLYNQKMFMGKRTRIRFCYTGPSLQAVLDRFPTAEVIHQDDTGAEISAMVEYSRGTIMELLLQGSWVKALGPEKLVEDMKKELQKIGALYDILHDDNLREEIKDDRK